ncbi:glutaredoxin family protein [Patescibacteria group bacterium]|nr:glutaredoxin family protein [Patescibacteria group bacterium]
MDKKVTIYSTPTCHFCQMSKEYFNANGIEYTDINVAADQEKRAEMIEKSGQMGVPVIFVGDEMIIGFDKRRFDELFGTGGEPGM